jgi:hypothetical protein
MFDDNLTQNTMPRRVKGRGGKLPVVQTRVPTQVLDYLRAIAAHRYGSMTNLFNEWLPKFIGHQPWTQGLSWRYAKSTKAQTRVDNGVEIKSTNWVLVNASVNPEIREAVLAHSEACNVSMSTFVYTFVYWLIAYVFPPAQPTTKQGA